MSQPYSVDCVVIGAGVVGLAVARAMALNGREVMVLEAAQAIGTGTSSRNSEVIHAGLYYPAGSLKASLCLAGSALLYAYCQERAIGHQRCGKLIVATDAAQQRQLAAIEAHAVANGVGDLRQLSQHEALAMEPELRCVAALYSPNTGIVDSHALMLSLRADIEAAGGILVLNCAVARAFIAQDAINIVVNDGTVLRANSVVNAAGLSAQSVARQFSGLAASTIPPGYYAKGNYFSLTGRSPFRHLIYPVPQAAGLGIHATLDLSGQVKFGPDVQWVASPDDFSVDPLRGDAFYAAVRNYWPALEDGRLQPSYAGIRPKLQEPHQAAPHDFVIQGPREHGVAGLVNLFGIESPGLSACLAIGERVAQLLTP